MATDLEPIAGNWYQNLTDETIFEVVDVDEDESVVEIQHEDGSLAQVELEEWYQWDLDVIDEPEDWTQPMDDENDEDDEDDIDLDPEDEFEPDSRAEPARRRGVGRSQSTGSTGWDEEA